MMKDLQNETEFKHF